MTDCVTFMDSEFTVLTVRIGPERFEDSKNSNSVGAQLHDWGPCITWHKVCLDQVMGFTFFVGVEYPRPARLSDISKRSCYGTYWAYKHFR